jgi:ribosomal protein S18 acetylase RimI-like enzyme
MTDAYTMRTVPLPEDVPVVREIVAATGFFSDEEITIAGELVEETLVKGAAAGYHFIFAESAGTLIGYCCFGPIPLTRESYDIYWVAVMPGCQGSGLGRRLMKVAEDTIKDFGGRRSYADTSSRAQYQPTRNFYEALGYRQEASLPDFYAPGDGKVVYCKIL